MGDTSSEALGVTQATTPGRVTGRDEAGSPRSGPGLGFTHCWVSGRHTHSMSSSVVHTGAVAPFPCAAVAPSRLKAPSAMWTGGCHWLDAHGADLVCIFLRLHVGLHEFFCTESVKTSHTRTPARLQASTPERIGEPG